MVSPTSRHAALIAAVVALAFEELAERPEAGPQLTGGGEVDARGAPDRPRRGARPSASPERTRRPTTIGAARRDSAWSSTTPSPATTIRSGRQLAERAQALGVHLQPKVEVELKDIALRLVAAGIGDTYLPSAAPAPTTPRASTALHPRALRHIRNHYPPWDAASARCARAPTELEAHMRAVAGEYRPVTLSKRRSLLSGALDPRSHLARHQLDLPSLVAQRPEVDALASRRGVAGEKMPRSAPRGRRRAGPEARRDLDSIAARGPR